MTDKLKEQISALVDDELDAAEADLLLRRLDQDTELRGTVERYIVMGEAIRDALASAPMEGFSDRVAHAVAGDPLPEPATAAPGGRRVAYRAAGGFAIAATVATVAILSLQGTDQQTGPEIGPSGDPNAADYTVPPMPPQQMRLTNYFLSHSEYSTSMGPKGMLTRIVSHADFDVRDEEVLDDTEMDEQETGQQ